MNYFVIHAILQRILGSIYCVSLSFFWDSLTIKIIEKVFIYFQKHITPDCVLKIDYERETTYGYFSIKTKEIYLCPKAFHSHFISLIAKKEKNILSKIFYLMLFTLIHEYGHFIDSTTNASYSSQVYSYKGLYLQHFIKMYSFLKPEQFVEDDQFFVLLESAQNNYVNSELFAEETATSYFKKLNLEDGLTYCSKEILYTKDMLERSFRKKHIPDLLQEHFKKNCSFSEEQTLFIIRGLQMKLL